jgi:hypothetical protein
MASETASDALVQGDDPEAAMKKAVAAGLETYVTGKAAEGLLKNTGGFIKDAKGGKIGAAGESTGDTGYDAYLKMLDEVKKARESGMTAREYAKSKGIPSTLSDEEAAVLDKYGVKMLDDGAGDGTPGAAGEGTPKSTENIGSYFKDEQLKTESNTAYFWSGNSNGIGGKDFAMNHAAKNSGTTLESLMKNQGIEMPTWDISAPNSIKAWEDASARYAGQASGEVHALIGTTQRQNSVWRTIELPTLMDNTNVSKIILIDPETLKQTIIFRR